MTLKKSAVIGSGVAVLFLVAGFVVAQQAVTPSPPPKAASGWKAVTMTEGMERPWGIAWLPDGRMLVTERGGTMCLIEKDGTLLNDIITGLPPVEEIGQGGLMDVSLHPEFAKNQWVYLTVSGGTGRANRTELWRGKLVGTELQGVKQLFRVSQDKQGGQHFGSRILWLPDGTLLMSIGDGGNPPSMVEGQLSREWAQSKESHLGKVLRLTAEGKPAPGNPFSGSDVASSIFSMGHRNIQGLARDPASGRIWANEHGARGGDELNLIAKGKNFGWPKATYSINYGGSEISPNKTLPGMEDPIVVWTPCPAPSGLAFYTGSRYPNWKGDLFSGGLAGNDVRRIDLDANGKVLGQERLGIGQRVRDVRQGPDGFLYLLTDEVNGRLIRIEPTN